MGEVLEIRELANVPQSARTRQRYDARGRVVERWVYGAEVLATRSNPLETHTTYTYDLALGGLGQLYEEHILGSYPDVTPGVPVDIDQRHQYQYDALGRVQQRTVFIDGAQVGHPEISVYDALGRVQRAADASGRWLKHEYGVTGAVRALCESSAGDASSNCPQSGSSTYLRTLSYDRENLDSHNSDESYKFWRIRPTDTPRSDCHACPMTTPRRQIVDPDTPGFFHCVSRCVRRAFLCGQDNYSGRSFEHRRQWVEDRLLELGEIFSVGVYAYAVMSNHLHVVLHADPLRPDQWSDEEVAERWVRLFPARVNGCVDEDACAAKIADLLKEPLRVAGLRQRLGSVSWFMRCLNEPIARRANYEDGCTGRFWEGRYKCQALLDEAAIAACMAYVDLNPVRAGMAADLISSDHTSIKRRLEVAPEDIPATELLRPLAGLVPDDVFPISLRDYIELVDWTGRVVRHDKRGAIGAAVPIAVTALGLKDRQWQTQVLGIESRYWRAVGAVESLIEKAQAMGQRWLKGGGRGGDCVPHPSS